MENWEHKDISFKTLIDYGFPVPQYQYTLDYSSLTFAKFEKVCNCSLKPVSNEILSPMSSQI